MQTKISRDQAVEERFSQLKILASNLALEVKVLPGNGAQIHARCQLTQGFQALVASAYCYGENSTEGHWGRTFYTLDILEKRLAYLKQKFKAL